MNILMYGWEFPPCNSGGLGVACQGIVGGLHENGHKVFLVLPHVTEGMAGAGPESLELLASHASGETLEGIAIPSMLYSPYTNPAEYEAFLKKNSSLREGDVKSLYGMNLMDEVARFAAQGAAYAKKTPHDIIHTHDWLTAEAGIQASRLSEKPHVMHVHATEFDRSGDNPNQQVYDLERRGMEQADRVIAVSDFTRQMLVKHYGIPAHKIDVVHNAVKPEARCHLARQSLGKKDKIVLFLGRMTMQKGPDYFLKMAKKVLEYRPDVKFVMAGNGDMMEQVIHMAVGLGIEKNILFAGFLKGEEVARAYASADLYVMPSVSEPFGIAPLEAIRNGAPVLISRQSGVSEVIKSALKTDFWDIDDMADKVIAVLDHAPLHDTLRDHGFHEVERFSWKDRARDIAEVYSRTVQGMLPKQSPAPIYLSL
jgi:glycosyltransferase involved in cell wall biosynthesis